MYKKKKDEKKKRKKKKEKRKSFFVRNEPSYSIYSHGKALR